MVFWLQVGFQVIFVLSWLRHLASEDSDSFEALCAADIYICPQSACSIGGLHSSVPSKPLSLPSFLLLPAPISAKDVFTNHFLVHLDPSHEPPDPPALARDIAKRNGFHSLGPLLNSPHEFHFVHEGLSHARHKRSIPHSRKLKTDPQVHRVYQQTGFRRVKRGYREEPDYMALGPKG